MIRRDFIKFIALLAAGAAAKPEQILAFTHYYDRNATKADPLVSVDEIQISGIATTSQVIVPSFYRGSEKLMDLAFNAFGGVILWRAMPDAKILCGPGEFRWGIGSPTYDDDVTKIIRGYVSYIDQDGIRKFVDFAKPEGSLVGLRASALPPR